MEKYAAKKFVRFISQNRLDFKYVLKNKLCMKYIC